MSGSIKNSEFRGEYHSHSQYPSHNGKQCVEQFVIADAGKFRKEFETVTDNYNQHKGDQRGKRPISRKYPHCRELEKCTHSDADIKMPPLITFDFLHQDVTIGGGGLTDRQYTRI